MEVGIESSAELTGYLYTVTSGKLHLSPPLLHTTSTQPKYEKNNTHDPTTCYRHPQSHVERNVLPIC